MILISKTYWSGMPFFYKGKLPEGTRVEPVMLKSDDWRDITGLFYRPAAARHSVAVLVMHPKVDFTRHYCIPPFVDAGIACLGLTTRCLNNDTMAIHEDLILDVNAGVKFLRQQGYEKVVLFGNSGGGALSAFFQAQAQLPKGQRLTHTPAGDPTKLNRAEMVPADALITVSAHRGEGHVLMQSIDPSVVDERDPTQTDAGIDMYNQANGFAPPPSPSHYSADFVVRYRAAQRARVARLDAMARAMIDEARHYDKAYADAPDDMDFVARQRLGRLGAMERIMVIYRTMANLNYTDPTLEPSLRGYGSLLSERPDLMNYQSTGFARILRPEAWLSTWSALSSHASTEKHLSEIHGIPILMVNALKDKEIFPETDAKPLWASVKVADRTLFDIDAQHYFEGEPGQADAPDVTRLMATVIPWVLERFGR